MIYKVNLIEEDKQRAMKYAKAVIETVNYTNRGQSDKEKATFDHYVGKLGEIAVFIILKNEGRTVTEPDFEIHHKKSWDDDLYVDGVGVAIKTQTRQSAMRYGLSWTFHVNDPVLNMPEKAVYFTEYTPNTIYVYYPEFKIKDLPFKLPVIERLKPFKRVVYAKDLSIEKIYS